MTPFKDERVDYSAFKTNVRRWNSTDCAGILVAGSTGEAVALDTEEKMRLIFAAKDQLAAGKQLIVGIGAESVATTVRMGRSAAELGADYVLVVNPHYAKPNLTPEVLRCYFLAIADQLTVPVLLYNIPQFTGINLPPQLVSALLQHSNIVGIKDSSGNLKQMFELLQNSREFMVLSGDLNSLVPALSLGANGAILAFANAVPQQLCEVYRLISQKHDNAAMKKMIPILSLAQMTIGRYGIPGLKVLMEYFSYQPGAPRLPFAPVTTEQAAEIRQAYEAFAATVSASSPD